MAQPTTSEIRVFTDAFAKALTQEPRSPKVAAGIDWKAEFCKDWPTVEGLLKILQSVTPQPISGLIGALIAGGDALQKSVCGK